jgi:hypothetical protein
MEAAMRKLIGMAWGAATHVAWYVTYRVGGDQRSRPTP